jgi:hypothetical protein
VDQVPRKEFEVEPNVRDRKIYNPTCQRGNEHKGVFFFFVWRGKGDKVRGREKTPLPELGGKGGTFSFTSNRDENAIENVVFQFAQVAWSSRSSQLGCKVGPIFCFPPTFRSVPSRFPSPQPSWMLWEKIYK